MEYQGNSESFEIVTENPTQAHTAKIHHKYIQKNLINGYL